MVNFRQNIEHWRENCNKIKENYRIFGRNTMRKGKNVTDIKNKSKLYKIETVRIKILFILWNYKNHSYNSTLNISKQKIRN